MGMTNTKAAKMAAVLEAYSEGKEIQYRNPIAGPWVSTKDHDFNFHVYEYRIKPPTPRVLYANLYEEPIRGYLYDSEDKARREAEGSKATAIARKFVEAFDEGEI